MAERRAGGNDAVALIAYTGATGAILFVLITMLGPVSGCHINPAVTLAMALRRAIGPRHAALYVLVQLLAGVAAAWTAHLMFELPMLQLSLKSRTGTGQWAGEFVATFGLVLTIVGTARHRPRAVPAAVALYISSAYWFTSSTSFANPAITVARSLTDSFSGIAPADVPGFVAAQLAGAVAGVVAGGWLFAQQEANP
jgi:glycerol uptake facilitator-like aquaporin